HMQSMDAPFSRTHFLNAIRWAAGDLEPTGLHSRRPSAGGGPRLAGSRVDCAAVTDCRVEVFSLQGRRVLRTAGAGPLRLDLGRTLPPGAYRIRLSAGDGSASR